ncbi:SAF domain-containing protein [Mycolicibacterium goodii]|uniref:SAF domain-containing protein n=1 Tax=Mycolicibacterium goodii TaxID=134601 RepID=UPI001F04738A|nr:SAF domain-containing protein [Mycolicibacterium goodii]ULN46565.1 SAF domain-containing protein [Mycolicibacterium goodii]
MAESLNPSAWHRLTAALRPDWTRTVAARRAAAAGLVLLAAVAAVRSDPRADHVDVAVATRDLAPGTALTAEDVRLESRSASTLPDGAQSDVAAMIGATLAGPMRRGEVLTDVRVLGSRLAELAVGPDARIVPLPLGDAALLDVIRAGDVVDVLTTYDDEANGAKPRLIASDAVVALISQKPKGAGQDRVALVALPARSANEVAAASLVQALTLTIH